MTLEPKGRGLSLRARLLIGILLPALLLLAIDAVLSYRSALRAGHAAFDRMLVASVHAIGDQLSVDRGRIAVALPRAALEIYEADVGGEIIYRIDGPRGEFVAGDTELPPYAGEFDPYARYPATARLYDTEFQGRPVRVAALSQPVFSAGGSGRAVVQVAEPLAARERLARELLFNTLIREALLLVAIALLVTLAVQRALRPLAELRAQIDQRSPGELGALATPAGAPELRPLVRGMNDLLERLGRLLELQARFIADASHQLLTPLAVLKTQLQSGLRGDLAADAAVREGAATVDRAIGLARQLLSLARIEQARGAGGTELCDLSMIAREVGLELAPLIVDRQLDFEYQSAAATVRGVPWMVSELVRNLLHNAIRHAPPQGRLEIEVGNRDGAAWLEVRDQGPGLSPDQQARLFTRFAGTPGASGNGLGLAICKEIVTAMGARIRLDNRVQDGRIAGLSARVDFPAA